MNLDTEIARGAEPTHHRFVPTGSPLPHGATFTATRGLMLAVLEQAIADHQIAARIRATRQGRLRCTDTYRWFHSRDQRRLFAFESVCDALDIDATAIRRHVGVV